MTKLLRMEFDAIGITGLKGHVVKIVRDKGGNGGSNRRVKAKISSNSRETATDASSKERTPARAKIGRAEVNHFFDTEKGISIAIRIIGRELMKASMHDGKAHRLGEELGRAESRVRRGRHARGKTGRNDRVDARRRGGSCGGESGRRHRGTRSGSHGIIGKGRWIRLGRHSSGLRRRMRKKAHNLLDPHLSRRR